MKEFDALVVDWSTDFEGGMKVYEWSRAAYLIYFFLLAAPSAALPVHAAERCR